GGDGGRLEPARGFREDPAAADRARPRRDVGLRVHHELERVHLRARAAQRSVEADGDGVALLFPGVEQAHGLGRADGRLDADCDPGRRVLPARTAQDRVRADRGRRQGVIPKPASAPRFEWRGVMLDVARHFFGVDDVKRFVDLIAVYKLNRLHLHLTDDQGWRIEIRSRPRLAEQGEHFTQDEYAEIVAHAESRGITVVPEIDLPGHVNAALVAYPELAPPGVVPEPYS